jgi:hypothetical protein
MADTDPTGGTPSVSQSLPNNFTMSATGERLDGATSGDRSPSPTPSATPVTEKKETQKAPTIPQEALSTRLERARKAERERLLKAIGYESPEKAKADFEELKKLREEREKAEREKMTELQRIQADLEAERKMRSELEAKLREESTARLYEKQDSAIYQIASRHVDSSSLKLKTAKREFAEYIDSLPKSQVSRMSEKDIEKWFIKFTKENPEFARKTDAPPAPAPVAKPLDPIKKPAGAPPSTKKVVAPAPVGSSKDPTIDERGKTVKPGLPNSMSKAEIAAYLKKIGLHSYR